MSYILDALQRADQERNLGEVPKLDMALQPARAGQRQSRWPTAVLVLIIASLVATIGWLVERGVLDDLIGEEAQSQVTAQASQQTPPLQTAVAAPTRAVANEPPVVAPLAEQPARPVADNSLEPSTLAAPVSQSPAEQARQPEAARSALPATSKDRPAPAVVAEPQAVKPAVPEEDKRSPRLPTPTVAPAPPPNWARNGQARETAEQDAPPRQPLISYLGLPKTTRDSMPALNMNAHVFSTNPSRSFVLINTKRYRIGDYLAEGPELVDILPDGAVLEHRGKQFLLPVQR